MNDYPSPPVLIIASTFLLAGIVKGVTGMGLATVAVGILGAIMSPVSAASLPVIPSFVTSSWQLFTGPDFLAVMKRLAEAKSHLGSLDRIKRCVWVGGMVNACTEFRDHPAVINEVSQLFLDVFGEAGEHARVAFGVGDALSMHRSRCKRFLNSNNVGACRG